MRVRAVVMAGCFCLAMISAPSVAGARSVIPNGYSMPLAIASWDEGVIALERISGDPDVCDYKPVDSVDAATGAVTCAGDFAAQDGCYRGSLKVEVVAWGKRASFTGRKDCALHPKGCLKAGGSHDPRNDCSNTGTAQTGLINVKGCWSRDQEVAAYCVGIRHTADVARRRHVSTVVRWKVSLNGARIGAGAMSFKTTFTPGVKSTPGKRIYSDTNFDSYYNYCLKPPWPETYASHGRIYCWHPGTRGRAGKWADKTKDLWSTGWE